MKDVGVGSIVYHKCSEKVKMVVITDKEAEHGVKYYECRWYDERSGCFKEKDFQESELIFGFRR
jgi:hypothetical protein